MLDAHCEDRQDCYIWRVSHAIWVNADERENESRRLEETETWTYSTVWCSSPPLSGCPTGESCESSCLHLGDFAGVFSLGRYVWRFFELGWSEKARMQELLLSCKKCIKPVYKYASSGS